MRKANGIMLSTDTFQNQLVEGDLFDKVVFAEDDVMKFRIIEDMRFEKYGSRLVERAANFRKIGKKFRIGELFIALVHELFLNVFFFENLCPDTKHNASITRMKKKINLFEK